MISVKFCKKFCNFFAKILRISEKIAKIKLKPGDTYTESGEECLLSNAAKPWNWLIDWLSYPWTRSLLWWCKGTHGGIVTRELASCGAKASHHRLWGKLSQCGFLCFRIWRKRCDKFPSFPQLLCTRKRPQTYHACGYEIFSCNHGVRSVVRRLRTTGWGKFGTWGNRGFRSRRTRCTARKIFLRSFAPEKNIFRAWTEATIVSFYFFIFLLIFILPFLCFFNLQNVHIPKYAKFQFCPKECTSRNSAKSVCPFTTW